MQLKLNKLSIVWDTVESLGRSDMPYRVISQYDIITVAGNNTISSLDVTNTELTHMQLSSIGSFNSLINKPK